MNLFVKYYYSKFLVVSSVFLVYSFSAIYAQIGNGIGLESFELFSKDKFVSTIDNAHVKEEFKTQNNCTDEDLEKLSCEFIALAKITIQIYENKHVLESKYAFLRDSLVDLYKHIYDEYKETGVIHHRHPLLGQNHDHIDRNKIPERNPNVEWSAEELVFNSRTNTCFNADFENANLDGWSGAYATTSGEGNLQAGWDMGAMNSTNGNHAIMGPGAGMDPRSGNAFPRVFPGGGGYSLRLGNEGTGWQAAQVRYTFNVTTDTELFLYHFAVVMEDPGHPPAEQPYLRINLIIGGVNIDCGEYFQASQAGAVGFLDGPGDVRYRPWSTVSIALTDFIGQTATVEFTSADCSQAGHFGYAYIDAECMPMPSLESGMLTCGNLQVTLTAPEGADSYQWSGPGIVGPNNTQSITVDEPGDYSVQIIPVQGPACAYSLETTITQELAEVDALFSASPLEICLGESIDFTDESIATGPDPIAIWEWDFGDGNTSGTQNPSHVYTNPGVYTVELRSALANNCGDTYTLDVEVIDVPIPDFDFIEVCEGGEVDFTNTSQIQAPYTILSNEWDIMDNGTVDYNSENATHTFNEAGTFDVKLTVEGDGGCSNEIIKPITIFSNPEVDFSVIPDCDGAPFQFNDETTVDNASIASWDWNFNDNATSVDQNPNHIFSAFGDYTVTLNVTTDQGCEGEASNEVTISPLPEIDAGEDQTICSGEQVVLSASGGVSYTWSDGVVNGQAFTPPSTLTYTVTGVDANGCENSDEVEVIVNPLPNVNAGNNQEICIGEEVTLSGSGAVTYTWNNGVDDGVPFAPTTTMIYTVTGVDANGCENTDEVEVVVNPLPNVNAGPDQVICIGEEVTLSGSGAVNYSWDNNVVNGVAFAPTTTATYTVTGVDANGCENTDNVEVVVNELPVVNAGEDQEICIGEQVTLTAIGATTYSWNNSVQNGVSFSPTSTTTYTVVGSNANGCESTDEVMVIVNPLPIIDAGPNQSLCEGENVVLEAQGGVSYSWTNGVDNGVPFSQPVGSVTYTVTGTDANGCSNFDQVNVIIHPNPTVFAGNDLTICAGETVLLTATGANTYVWDNNVVNGQSFTPSVTTTYTVVGSTNQGCTDSDDVIVTVIPIPNPTFEGINLEGCAPLTPELTNMTVGSNLETCTWTFGDGTVIESCDQAILTFEEPGCYDVALTVSTPEGCSYSTNIPNYICVLEPPIAAFSANPTYLTSVSTESHFTNESIGANFYSWDFGDGSGSTETDPIHKFPDPTEEYTITLTAYSAEGCLDTAMLTIRVEETVLFYVPNAFTPDKDQYNEVFKPIFSTGFDPFNYKLLIFNRWGEVLFESNDPDVGWSGKYGINGNIVKEGVYVWKIIFKRKADGGEEMHVGHVSLLK